MMDKKSGAPQKKQITLGLMVAPGPNGGGTVLELQRFGSFAKAGVQVGDEILACNGKKLVDMVQLEKDLDAVGIGNSVTVTLIRGGKQVELPMKLFERKVLSLEVKALEEVLERKISP